jgi:hypothetical protein
LERNNKMKEIIDYYRWLDTKELKEQIGFIGSFCTLKNIKHGHYDLDMESYLTGLVSEYKMRKFFDAANLSVPRKISDWPYSGACNCNYLFDNGINLWLETIEKFYYDQLECVPPAAQSIYSFIVSEPYKIGINTMFVEVGKRFFCKNISFDKKKIKDYNGFSNFSKVCIDEIVNQFEICGAY